MSETIDETKPVEATATTRDAGVVRPWTGTDNAFIALHDWIIAEFEKVKNSTEVAELKAKVAALEAKVTPAKVAPVDPVHSAFVPTETVAAHSAFVPEAVPYTPPAPVYEPPVSSCGTVITTE